jgi:phage terminase large subunit
VSLSDLEIKTAEVFEPLLAPARYKGAHGGRGSGKSHFFAEYVVEEHLRLPGCRTVCIREVLKSLKQSAKLLIEDKIQALGVGDKFDVQSARIVTPGNGLIVFEGMQDHTAETIKSLEGFDRAWVEEAQSLSARSLSMLRPTIRKPDSEIWFSWNPTRKSDAVDEFLRVKKPDGAIVVQANWKDNPWFPSVLEQERQQDLKLYPERYDHIWEGDYAKAFEGAYFATGLSAAKREGRIGKVTADPMLPIRAFIDIGGSGANADAFVIWIVQWIGQEIRVLDYYESIGQAAGYHAQWLRDKGYVKAILQFPHDGANANAITGKRYQDHFADAGFNVDPAKANMGAGAVSMRIEAVRRLLPKMWFNETTTEPGRDALGFYHEKRDSDRNVGLGPEHDWSSHAADAFGLMAICYEEPSRSANFNRKLTYHTKGFA